MDRHARVALACVVVLSQVAIRGAGAGEERGSPQRPAASAQGRSDHRDLVVLGAIRANPLTAPYPVFTSVQ
jgi:hypothetical protein